MAPQSVSNQPLANFYCTVELRGRKASIEQVYESLTKRRGKTNARTGAPFTEFGELEIEKKTGDDTGRFTVTRRFIYGNYENDVARAVNRAIGRSNVDVEKKLVNIKREVIEMSGDVEPVTEGVE